MSKYSILSEVISDENLNNVMSSMNTSFTDEEFICGYIREYPKDDFHRLLAFISKYGMTELLAYGRQQLLPKTICRRLKLAHKVKTKLKGKDSGTKWKKDMETFNLKWI